MVPRGEFSAKSPYMVQTIRGDKGNLFLSGQGLSCKWQNFYQRFSIPSEPIYYKRFGVTKRTYVVSLLHDLGSKTDLASNDEGAIRDSAAAAFVGGSDTVIRSGRKSI